MTTLVFYRPVMIARRDSFRKAFDPTEPREPKGKKTGGRWAKLAAGDPHPFGHIPTTAEERAKVQAMGPSRPVPPTSWGLEIHPNARNPKLLATFRDDQNRVQYIYDANYTARQDRVKFESLHNFAKKLPLIRKMIARDIRKPGLTRERVAAGILRIIDTTAIRIGSEKYAEENETFGATSMRKSHVTVKGNLVRFQFIGKKGKAHDVSMRDPAVAELVRELMKLPGDRLMKYEGRGGISDLTERTLNEYLPAGLHVHQFRHYVGTAVCAKALERFGPPATLAEAKKNVLAAIDMAAESLHNERASARKSYIDPAVINRYMEGVQ